MDLSHESHNAAPQANRFDDSFSDNVNTGSEFSSKSDSARNPFMVASESPKKQASTNLFQKSSEMMMATKNNRYDVFKNELVAGREEPVVVVAAKVPTDVNPDLFKDFAAAAFSEFKVEKTSSLVHEFSNRLSDQKHHRNGHQMMKVKARSEQACQCEKCFVLIVHVWMISTNITENNLTADVSFVKHISGPQKSLCVVELFVLWLSLLLLLLLLSLARLFMFHAFVFGCF